MSRRADPKTNTAAFKAEVSWMLRTAAPKTNTAAFKAEDSRCS